MHHSPFYVSEFCVLILFVLLFSTVSYMLFSILNYYWKSYLRTKEWLKRSQTPEFIEQKRINDLESAKRRAERDSMYNHFGNYAVTDYYEMAALRYLISYLSENGYDLKGIHQGIDGKSCAYLTYNYDR